MNKKSIRVDVYKEELPSIPSRPKAFLKYFDNFVQSVPEEYRDDINIRLDAIDSWGQSTLVLEIYYYRPETDREYTARAESERLAKELERRGELKELQRLQEKYKDD